MSHYNSTSRRRCYNSVWIGKKLSNWVKSSKYPLQSNITCHQVTNVNISSYILLVIFICHVSIAFFNQSLLRHIFPAWRSFSLQSQHLHMLSRSISYIVCTKRTNGNVWASKQFVTTSMFKNIQNLDLLWLFHNNEQEIQDVFISRSFCLKLQIVYLSS